MRIAAVGDSFMEGIGDEVVGPDGVLGEPRGWADRVVEQLAQRLDEPVYYANFAIRGRILKPIATTQLDAALALDPKPDLILFNGGGNDMLRPTFNVKKMIRLTELAIDKCREAGVRLVFVTGAHPTERLPLARRMDGRGDAYMDAATELVSRTGNELISNWGDDHIRDARYWADDRLHLGPLGHERVAAAVLTALGYPTDFPDEGDPAPPATFRSEAHYARVHVLPYIGRRLASRSTGRGREPKYATWHLMGE
ncbi:SGNH/GDSL hydrolase family protein [Demequina sp.]|uniref:SGNH/GDSL hydrolase family protein n=1 Tax=Demequina sp. TaxID=2050685 RepID=UPI003D0D8211